MAIISSSTEPSPVEAVERVIGYRFKDKRLITQALTHCSTLATLDSVASPSYERLEFIGDAALGLALANFAFIKYPHLDPHRLSLLRSANLSTEKLARVAVRHGFFDHLLHSSPSLHLEVRKFTLAIQQEEEEYYYGGEYLKAPKVLADIVESIAAAIYVDSDYNLKLLWEVYRPLLEPIVKLENLHQHPITMLYETCQKQGKMVDFGQFWKGQKIVYTAIVDGKILGIGCSEQKDIAKLNAAKEALQTINNLESSMDINDPCVANGLPEIPEAKQKLKMFCDKKHWPNPMYSFARMDATGSGASRGGRTPTSDPGTGTGTGTGTGRGRGRASPSITHTHTPASQFHPPTGNAFISHHGNTEPAADTKSHTTNNIANVRSHKTPSATNQKGQTPPHSSFKGSPPSKFTMGYLPTSPSNLDTSAGASRSNSPPKMGHSLRQSNVEPSSSFSNQSGTLSGDKHSDDIQSPHQPTEEKITPFDICIVTSGVKLKPSLFEQNRQVRKHTVNASKKNASEKDYQILRPGMILLKNYLARKDQIDIVKICRKLGQGSGGFYQPGYKDGAKLHLHMMCLGRNWDPEHRLYEERRSVDGAVAPPIPHKFNDVVQLAIKDSHELIKETHKLYNPEEELPSMQPDICIVNFYSRTGKLGLHQDRDESSGSLSKGLPVVSFSIGDSALFSYGDDRDVDKADEVLLESGDVLIFGGESRHVFHGVPSITANSAPKFLAEEANLKPGRLNLTFRQY